MPFINDFICIWRYKQMPTSETTNMGIGYPCGRPPVLHPRSPLVSGYLRVQFFDRLNIVGTGFLAPPLVSTVQLRCHVKKAQMSGAFAIVLLKVGQEMSVTWPSAMGMSYWNPTSPLLFTTKSLVNGCSYLLFLCSKPIPKDLPDSWHSLASSVVVCCSSVNKRSTNNGQLGIHSWHFQY